VRNTYDWPNVEETYARAFQAILTSTEE
jgi:hypothetical protein